MSSGSIPLRAKNSPAVVVGSRSGGPTSQRSLSERGRGDPASAGQRVTGRGDDHQPRAQERDRRDRGGALRARVRAERDVGAAMLEHVGERFARDRFDRDLQARAAGTERVDQRADVLGDDAGRGDLQLPRLAGRLLDAAPGLFGQAEDLAAQRGQPAAPGGQRDPAPIADEQLVAELLTSAATATDTAGSVTSSSAAAALTDPGERRGRRTAAGRGSSGLTGSR